MDEEKIIEGEATEIDAKLTETGAGAKQHEEKGRVPKATAAALKDAVESLGNAVSMALQDRANVVMVRVNDEALLHMDMLVEAEITKSRSESAAFLITEGVKSNSQLFSKIGTITEQITALRAELREVVKMEEKE